jgi:hypothetical protein
VSERSARDFYDDLAPDYAEIFADWEASIRYRAGVLEPLLGEAPDPVLDVAAGMGTQVFIPWYSCGMKHAAKVAVSLPAQTLARLERARKRLGATRSAVVARALDEWLATVEPSAIDRRYAEAYRRHPETAAEIAAAAAIASATMTGDEEW